MLICTVDRFPGNSAKIIFKTTSCWQSTELTKRKLDAAAVDDDDNDDNDDNDILKIDAKIGSDLRR